MLLSNRKNSSYVINMKSFWLQLFLLQWLIATRPEIIQNLHHSVPTAQKKPSLACCSGWKQLSHKWCQLYVHCVLPCYALWEIRPLRPINPINTVGLRKKIYLLPCTVCIITIYVNFYSRSNEEPIVMPDGHHHCFYILDLQPRILRLSAACQYVL